jgi:hypothetical protein
LTDLDQRSDQRDKREHGASGNLYAPVEMIVHKGAAQGVSLAFKRRCEGAQGWSRIAKLGQV